MKSRVISALNGIVKGNDNKLGKLLCEDLQISPEQLSARASIVLKNILHHYSDLSIGTIDSFTHKIVKTFAHDLELPVNFNIELDTQSFYEKVVAELFSAIGEDEYVSKLLKDYALSKASENAAWDPEGHIREFAGLLQKENSGDYIEKLRHFEAHELETFRQQFLDFIRHYRQTVQSTGQKAIQLIKSKELTDEDFNYKSGGPQSFFRKCAELRVTPADTEGARIREALQNNRWAGKGGNKIIDGIAPQLKQIAEELIDFVRGNYTYFSLCEMLSKQMYPLMLLKKIEEISQARKQEERLVFISEFNQKIFDIINSEPTPFIYERLGEKFQHYLLDEFQDTSNLQWQNLLPLIDNSLANGWFNLVVGDGKQSIYRWRNADVQQFAGLPLIANPDNSPVVKERADTLLRNHEDKLLNINYRSSKAVIEFNNEFFAEENQLSDQPDHLKIYDRHKQEVINQHEGFVSIDAGKMPGNEVSERHLALLFKYIQSALEDGYKLRDICIICRKNEHGSLVAAELISKKIPVVSSESLLLANSLEINTLICFLRYIADEQDIISAAAVVNYLRHARKLHPDKVHEMLKKLSSGVSLYDVLTDAGLQVNPNSFGSVNIFDCCILISDLLSLQNNAGQYIRFFLDEILEFLSQHNSGLPEFFEWWDVRSRKASLVIPEGTDAVRIMTIHSSKGLEFPVVIIPFCNWNIYRSGDSWVEVRTEKTQLPVSVVHLSRKAEDSGFELEYRKEVEAQRLDNINLLYVAFTRAADRLHIISTSAEGARESVAGWIQNFANRQSGQPETVHYEKGKPEKCPAERHQSGTGALHLEPLQFYDSGTQIRIKAAAKKNSQEAENARKVGILMHWLLGSLSTSGDIEKAVAAGVLSGDVPNDAVEEICEKLKKICSLPELLPAFQLNASIKREAELITSNGDILRPDRLYFENNAVTIIDYKTGKEDNVKYGKQLAGYAVALQQMGFDKIRKLIVYLDQLKVVELN